MIKFSYIKKLPGGKYKVLSEKGHNFGVYDSKEKAQKRLKQIMLWKFINNRFKKRKAFLESLLVKISQEETYSSKMRQLSMEDKLIFMKCFKEAFDEAIESNLEDPSKLALLEAKKKLIEK